MLSVQLFLLNICVHLFISITLQYMSVKSYVMTNLSKDHY